MPLRPATADDFDAIHRIFRDVTASGDTYVFDADTGIDDVRAYWLGPDVTCVVAELDGAVVGMYRLVPNQRGRGAHVANASFMTDPQARGRGIGLAMGRHCLAEARRAGFRAMQFNVVVSTNHAAVALWTRLGFFIAGTLPKAFRHATQGDVDAYVMYRFLDGADDIPNPSAANP